MGLIVKMTVNIHERSINILNAIKYGVTFLYIFICSFMLERKGYITEGLVHFGFILGILLITIRIINSVIRMEREEEASTKINNCIRYYIIKKYEMEYEIEWKLRNPNKPYMLNKTVQNNEFLINAVEDTYLREVGKPNKSFIVHTTNSSESDDDNCIICLEKLGTKGITIGCNHKGHYRCLKRWFDTEWSNKKNELFPNSCPVCRSSIINYYSRPQLSMNSTLNLMMISRND